MVFQDAVVVGVHRNPRHGFSKLPQESVTLLAGLGVEGDAHRGVTVKHRWDAKRDPRRPNRRQVHLLQAELLDEVNTRGFEVKPGDLGENITTRGIDLLGLSTGARLHVGEDAIVEITGLRAPCVYIDRFRKGLLAAVIERRVDGAANYKSGVMAIVVRGGVVRTADAVAIERPPGPHRPLQPV